MNPAATDLPIDEVLGQIRDTLRHETRLVIEAPPGAGKTTRVPLALLDEPWLGEEKILLLEPRRVAARAAAARLAEGVGDAVGRTVGFRVRHDTKVSARTRIEVVTEGVLTRMLQSDPGLESVGVVIFDEFHERSLHADVGLALTLEAAEALRPDLRVVVMSATLDGRAVAAALGGATVVRSDGRQHPVQTVYRPRPGGTDIETDTTATVELALPDADGDLLVFLPGAGWIRRTGDLLARHLPSSAVVTPLYGLLSPEEQDRALLPDPEGRRKIILSTDIAETSLTIDGVRLVIDSGLRRSPRFDPGSGLTRLQTISISKAAADQRRGRAGRQGPGVCYRLWSQHEHAQRPEHERPEILNADLSGLALELGLWGADAAELTWLDAPPPMALTDARALLRLLGALDDDDRITQHGRAMARLGADPRIAHMLLQAKALGHGALACDLAGILVNRDPLVDRSDADLRTRLDLLSGRSRKSARWGALEAARTSSHRWRRQLHATERDAIDPDAAGLVVSLAFPDRIAAARSTPGTVLLASGRGGTVTGALADEPLLAVAEIDGDPTRSTIYLAAPLDRADLESQHGHRFSTAETVHWDTRRGDIVAEEQTRLGAIVLTRRPLQDPDPDLVAAAVRQGLTHEGIDLLGFSEETERWRERVRFCRIHLGEEWPDVTDESLLAAADHWLAPFLGRVRRRKDLGRVDADQAVRSLLSWPQSAELDRLAPTHLEVPSGSNVRIDYADPSAPVLAVRLQEVFGLTETPRLADGRVPVVMHLLSPASRPVQVTSDLASFWASAYHEVKAELKGRYPKHHWPDDPLTAVATNRTKRRR
ncbi:MAG: ATP-dependent helicase HrpB [Acidimicrobiales bacterium]|nr:ATP-dependent helicase HrpB [Acidimicrobiales bacterium]